MIHSIIEDFTDDDHRLNSWRIYRWLYWTLIGPPRRLSGEESACQCRRHGFHSWVGKIPWRREWQPTPVFLPGESHAEEPGGLQSMGSQSRARPKQLSRHACPEIVVDFYSILIFYSNCSEIYCGFEIDPTSQPHDWVSAVWNGETPCGFCFGRDFCDLGMQLSDLFIPDADT